MGLKFLWSACDDWRYLNKWVAAFITKSAGQLKPNEAVAIPSGTFFFMMPVVAAIGCDTINHMVKVAIEVLFSGKDFKDLEKSDLTDEEKLLIQAMAADAEAALLPLREAIEQEGGGVIVDFKTSAMFQIETKDLSDELKEKVYSALRPGKARK